MISTFSLEAEQSVLGGILISNDVLYVINEILNCDDFYYKEHEHIFKCSNELLIEKRPIDFLTLSEKIKENNFESERLTENYLYELSTSIPSIANIEAYAKIVREKAIRRKLTQIYAEGVENLKNKKDILEIVNLSQSAILGLNLTKNEKEAVRSSDVMYKIFEDISDGKKKTGEKTGFKLLDNISGGLQKSDLIIIGARPSIGKTSFSVNIAENIAENAQYPVLVFSLEMSKEQLILRMISGHSNIEYKKIQQNELTEEEIVRIGNAICDQKFKMILIEDESILTPSMMRIKARKEFNKHGGLSLIIIDYLQKLYEPSFKNNKVQEITYIVSSIKSLAKELNIPIIALSQLNRSLESRADKRPILSDLRESGGIEQEADLVLFMYRDEVYNPDTYAKNICEISISKNRNGKIGVFNLNFVPEFTRFKNL